MNVIKRRLTNQGERRGSLQTDSEKLSDTETNTIINCLGNRAKTRKIIGKTSIQKHETK